MGLWWITAICVFAQSSPTAVEELFQKAKAGSELDLRILAGYSSPEARAALEKLTEQPGVSGYTYNRTLRLARAKAGIPEAYLLLAKDALFKRYGYILDALEMLESVGGPGLLRILRVMLDDDSGADNGGDVHYPPNAWAAMGLLPKVIPPAEQPLGPNGQIEKFDFSPVARQRWREWFREHDAAIPSEQAAELAAAARRSGSVDDAAAVLLLVPGQRLEFMNGPWGARPQSEGVQVLFDAVRVADGSIPCGESIVRRIRRLPGAEQRVVVKTLALMLKPAGAWILCRMRSTIMHGWLPPSDDSRTTQKLIEELLWQWKSDGSRMVPVDELRQRMEGCPKDGPAGGCLLKGK